MVQRYVVLGALAAILTACGRIGFDPLDADARVADLAIDAPLGPWSAPTPVALPVLGADDDPTLTGDLLDLYFNRTGNQIFASTRTAVGQPWSTPVLVDELSNPDGTVPDLIPSGLGIYYSTNRAGGLGGLDIWAAGRSSRASAWTGFGARVSLNSAANEFAGPTTLDDLEIVLSSDASGSLDILISVRATSDDGFPTPQPIPALATAGLEDEAFISLDGLALYYTGPGPDLYVSRRANRTDTFGVGTPIAELNSAAEDRDAWVSADGRYIMFSSTRGGTSRLYEAFR